MSTLQKLQFKGWRKLSEETERIDRFSEPTFDEYSLVLDVHQDTNGNRVFFLSVGFYYIGYTYDSSIAFQWLHNASIYTTDELHRFGRKGTPKPLPRVMKRHYVQNGIKHSCGVSYTEQRAYFWLRKA